MSIFKRTNTTAYRKKIEFCTEKLFVSSKTGYEQIGDLSPNSLILFSLVTSRSCQGVKKGLPQYFQGKSSYQNLYSHNI